MDAALPASLRHWIDDPGLIVPDFRVAVEVKRALQDLRAAVSQRRVVAFQYTQGDGLVISPRVRPLCLRYIGGTWTLGGWSVGESAFRVFRVYRIKDLETTSERYRYEPGRTVADFLAASERLGAGA